MGIGFIFSIWVLTGAIFIAKLASVRELVARLRREPALVQIATVLFLCVAVIHGSTKTSSHSNASSGSATSSAPVMRGGKWGLVDFDGNVVLPCAYDGLEWGTGDAGEPRFHGAVPDLIPGLDGYGR